MKNINKNWMKLSCAVLFIVVDTLLKTLMYKFQDQEVSIHTDLM